MFCLRTDVDEWNLPHESMKADCGLPYSNKTPSASTCKFPLVAESPYFLSLNISTARII